MSLNTDISPNPDSSGPSSLSLGKNILVAIGVAVGSLTVMMMIVMIYMRRQMTRQIIKSERKQSGSSIDESFGHHGIISYRSSFVKSNVGHVGPTTSTAELVNPMDYNNNLSQTSFNPPQSDKHHDKSITLSPPLKYLPARSTKSSFSSYITTYNGLERSTRTHIPLSNLQSAHMGRWSNWFSKKSLSDDAHNGTSPDDLPYSIGNQSPITHKKSLSFTNPGRQNEPLIEKDEQIPKIQNRFTHRPSKLNQSCSAAIDDGDHLDKVNEILIIKNLDKPTLIKSQKDQEFNLIHPKSNVGILTEVVDDTNQNKHKSFMGEISGIS
ncbi:hypothetical protein CROQUDRAFT_86925 [Cronartium quercuum f. sp. fusiforme G11]|uniref:Uncharacterized protein n=1 Tax=Cronartium quercuum f. sp. fusiforme G11 TaxID=708437 RepID=A0A9P6TG68_9BASI|nr:hypothetical protein CROQUDRAFT_86925 [Cronartium quercuum f. sp. fusiforme G11]